MYGNVNKDTANGMSIKEVVRRTGLSRNTIRKYVRDETGEPRYRMENPRPSQRLIDHEVHLRSMYESDLSRPLRERRSMQSLYEALVVKGYQGSYDTVRRYISRIKMSGSDKSQGYIPLEFDIGDALQFDWSHEIVVLGGIEQKIKVAHFRLSYSRKPFVIGYFRESQEMILDAFNRAFAFYGGVPKRAIIDNPKTMVTFIGKGKERKFHTRFLAHILALLNHYAIEPVACTPASGWEKGQVENQVKYLRGQIFTPKLRFDSLEDLNAYLEARCEVLQDKPHPEIKAQTIRSVFSEELEVLRPLGQVFDGYTERQVSVNGYCLARFDTNSYSVPCKHARRPMSLKAYADRIVLSDGLDTIAEHKRSFEKHQKFFCLWHYLPLFKERPGALRDGAPFKHWNMPNTLRMIWEHYKKQQGGDRDFIELLNLYHKHGHEAVDMSCKLAIEYKSLQLSAIISILYSLIETDAADEMAVKGNNYPSLTQPPEANCHRYDQLLTTGAMT